MILMICPQNFKSFISISPINKNLKSETFRNFWEALAWSGASSLFRPPPSPPPPSSGTRPSSPPVHPSPVSSATASSSASAATPICGAQEGGAPSRLQTGVLRHELRRRVSPHEVYRSASFDFYSRVRRAPGWPSARAGRGANHLNRRPPLLRTCPPAANAV